MPGKVIFLDRDGTINEEVHHLSRPEQLKLLDGAVEGLRMLMQEEYKLFVITNQSGIARGLYTESGLAEIHLTLDNMLRAQGVIIDGYYYCPHHPVEGNPPYRRSCSCRKPALGMLNQAASEHGLDLKNALFIGDSINDMRCGLALNGRAILVRTGYGAKHEFILEETWAGRVVVCNSLAEAAEAIISGKIPPPGEPIVQASDL
ncbi:D-glycero-alpha-D-manno-heptose-1,7-bisphosphate 7-phosphatase [Gemmatimonadota bacterium]